MPNTVPTPSSPVPPPVILTPLHAKDRAAAFAEMVDHLVALNRLPPDFRDRVLVSLEQREAKMTTAVGGRLALPHAGIPGLPEIITLIARSEQPISCNAPDGNPVQFFYLVLIPGNQYALHLRAMAHVSSLFHERRVRERLAACVTENDLRRLFAHP